LQEEVLVAAVGSAPACAHHSLLLLLPHMVVPPLLLLLLRLLLWLLLLLLPHGVDSAAPAHLLPNLPPLLLLLLLRLRVAPPLPLLHESSCWEAGTGRVWAAAPPAAPAADTTRRRSMSCCEPLLTCAQSLEYTGGRCKLAQVSTSRQPRTSMSLHRFGGSCLSECDNTEAWVKQQA
jgi:hypothetical protein